MQAGCQGAFSGQGDDKEVDRTIAGESGAEHAGRMSPSRTGGVDRPRGGCRDLFAPPRGSLPSPDGSSPCEGGSVCAGHRRLPVSGHISPSPPGVRRSCCRLCWRLGLALLTQSPAKGPEVPSSDRHRGHHVAGDIGDPVLPPWEMGWPCPPYHHLCLCPTSSGSGEQDSQSKRDTEDGPHQQV